MAACPCCGAELTGYERIVWFSKSALHTEIVLCCPCCRWQGVCRDDCPDHLA
ncbi:MAG: hypothetical protein JXA08_00730 [Methanomicrobiaceae archaeon]|nr:hypothetical protein [Methanomicrobiaceae archaeon]